jgi:hypothetical protein
MSVFGSNATSANIRFSAAHKGEADMKRGYSAMAFANYGRSLLLAL